MPISSDIVGVWKLRSFALVDSGGAQIKPFGEKPSGQVVFTAGGHVALVMTGEKRKPPRARRRRAKKPVRSSAVWRPPPGPIASRVTPSEFA